MCFRLLAAIRNRQNPSASSTDGLEQRAVKEGLDVRTVDKGRTGFLEIAWGDCACSLYTRREGAKRVASFVSALLGSGFTVQLLLFRDEEPLTTGETVASCSFEALQTQGLAALPEGQVTEVG